MNKKERHHRRQFIDSLTANKSKIGEDNKLSRYEYLPTVEKLIPEGSFILTLDTQRGLTRIPGIDPDIIKPEILTFNKDLIVALKKTFNPNKVNVAVVDEEPFYRGLEMLLNKAIVEAPSQNARVVLIDRFISTNTKSPNDYSTISVGRFSTPEGEVILERPGDPPLETQFAKLSDDLRKNGLTDQIIIVDDGLFDIKCLEEYEQIFKQRGFKVKGFYVGIGPFGKDQIDTLGSLRRSNRQVLALAPCSDIFDWVCARDFTFYGGKNCGKIGQNYLTAPYFAPFSDGTSASIPPEQLFAFSQEILIANINLVTSIQRKIRRILTFKDVMTAGYGLPTSLTEKFRNAQPEERIDNYLIEALIALRSGFGRVISNQDPELFLDIPNKKEILSRIREKSDQLIILCGCSGSGRSTLTQEILRQKPQSRRLKRTTTRSQRNEDEFSEIVPVNRDAFLQQVKSGTIISPVYYPPNKELYGISLDELTKVSTFKENEVAILEGAEDVFGIKRLFPKAKLVLLFPASFGVIRERLFQRNPNQPETETRIEKSKEQLKIITEKAPRLFTEGIADLIIISSQPKSDVQKILDALKSGQRIFEDLSDLEKSLRKENI